MSGFSSQWLTLREPFDAAARGEALATLMASTSRRPDSGLPIVDLGAGTGANLRYCAPRLGGAQNWVLVEHDRSLEAATEDRMRAWAATIGATVEHQAHTLRIQARDFDCRVTQMPLDLSTHLSRVPLGPDTLITCSALLDLVSEPWLRTLVQLAAVAQASLWFALTYDGCVECSPQESKDPMARELFNRHQLTDKGFGPALGPHAAQAARALLLEHGYDVQSVQSDWSIRASDRAFQNALLDEWFGAACECAPHLKPELDAWRGRRRAHIEAGRSSLRIGHADIVGRILHGSGQRTAP